MSTNQSLKRTANISPPSILVVDDFSAARGLVSELLAPLTTKITEAENGRQALDIITSSHFDLIISDYQMPEMDGITLCQELKKNSSTRGIPVLMLSNFDSPKDINRGFQAGATAYLSKTDTRDQLLPTAESILKKLRFQKEQLILIVDDSSSIRQLVVEGLSHYGFQIMEAENGVEAVQCIRQRRPDLILTDINMPEMDGFTLCQKVKTDPELASIPIVVMSVNADRAHMGRMVHHGISSYIVKPFNVDELIILINTLLSDQYLLLLKEKEFLTRERKLFLDSISSLITALEARDVYTMGHSDSVARIASGMLALTKASDDEIERIHLGARLHDIGKIGVRHKNPQSRGQPERYSLHCPFSPRTD
jgi:CheY-like chemotaxis protein